MFMKAVILLGNTRPKAISNTAALAQLFAQALADQGVEVDQVPLGEIQIQTCVGCDKCHAVLDAFGCAIHDGMEGVAGKILGADLVVFASPIYTWMPTPPLKAAMDRMYAFTKYPKGQEAFNLLTKQKIAVLATSGDAWEENCDLFEEAARRLAKFAKLAFLGLLAAKDPGGDPVESPETWEAAKAFAVKCAASLKK